MLGGQRELDRAVVGDCHEAIEGRDQLGLLVVEHARAHVRSRDDRAVAERLQTAAQRLSIRERACAVVYAGQVMTMQVATLRGAHACTSAAQLSISSSRVSR